MAKKRKQQNNTSNKQQATDRNQRYKYWVITIVKSVEATGELNKEAKIAYKEFESRFPHAKKLLDDLIQEVQQFSIYDSEPATVNFNYSAYLQKIQKLVE